MLNSLPCENGLSNILSPATLITRTPQLSYKEITKLKFGDYVEIPYEETRNNNTTRTMGGIVLYPSNKSSGGWYFISLITGYPVHKYTWTIRPASDLILLKVKEISQKHNKKLIGKNIKYFDKYLSKRMMDNIKNNDLDLNINSKTKNTNYEDNDDDLIDDIQIEGVRLIENVDHLKNIEITTNHQHESSTNTPYAAEYDEEQISTLLLITEEEPLTREIEDDEESDEMHNNYQINENRNRTGNENAEEEDEDEEVDIYNDRTPRDKARVDYNKLHNYRRTQMININEQPSTSNLDTFRKVIGITFNTLGRMNMSNKQLPIKRGTKKFGDKAIVAIMKEYTQLHNKEVFEPIENQNLKDEIKATSLHLIILVTQKRDGIIKRRSVTNGRQHKSREYFDESRTSSPTIQLESFMLSLLIDSFENKDVAIADIIGAYLFANMRDN